MNNYKDLDLSLFRLNDKGEPLALPFLQQWMKYGEAVTSSVKINAELGLSFNRMAMLYQSPFTPSTHLVGDKALFGGWKFDDDESELYEGFALVIEENIWKHYRVYGVKYGLNFYATKLDSYDYHEVSHTEEGTEHDDIEVPFSFGAKTLAHFINDCHRAGIELVWSPHAIKNLTK